VTRTIPFLLLLLAGCTRTTPILPGSLIPDHEVETFTTVIVDHERDREVPLRVWVPRTGGPLPVIIFSHGMGESKDSYAWFGRRFANSGYISIHPTHPGSDRAVLRSGWFNIFRASIDKDTWRNRPLDMQLVVSRLDEIERKIPSVAGRIDRSRIAAAGHSAGAFTAVALAGVTVDGAASADPRIRAAVAISMPDLSLILDEESFDTISIPVLHITGTRDYSLAYLTFPSDRRRMFDDTDAPDQFLVILDKATHTTFSDPHRPERKRQARLQELTAELTVRFIEAALNGGVDGSDSWTGPLPRDEMRIESKPKSLSQNMLAD
jgi:predicted dienelactone hydrolase